MPFIKYTFLKVQLWKCETQNEFIFEKKEKTLKFCIANVSRALAAHPQSLCLQTKRAIQH